MHIVGGYGEGRVDRAYHHVYDAKDDRWFNAAPLPRGANHVAVVADFTGRLPVLIETPASWRSSGAYGTVQPAVPVVRNAAMAWFWPRQAKAPR